MVVRGQGGGYPLSMSGFHCFKWSSLVDKFKLHKQTLPRSRDEMYPYHSMHHAADMVGTMLLKP